MRESAGERKESMDSCGKFVCLHLTVAGDASEKLNNDRVI
jgi:hypothetical protein